MRQASKLALIPTKVEVRFIDKSVKVYYLLYDLENVLIAQECGTHVLELLSKNFVVSYVKVR